MMMGRLRKAKKSAKDEKPEQKPKLEPTTPEAEKTEEHDATESAGTWGQTGQFPRLGVFDEPAPAADTRLSYDSSWLNDPVCVSADLSTASRTPASEFASILGSEMIASLQRNHIESFFPIQAVVISRLLDKAVLDLLVPPRDVCVASPTGSGKTLLYVLPIIVALRERVVPRIRALIVLPTQVLASQVSQCVATYTAGTDLKCLLLGVSSAEKERAMLWRKRITGAMVCDCADIVVATVGSLHRHLNFFDPHNPDAPASIDLSHLRFLVADEADHLMNDRRIDWSSQLLSAIYESPYATRGVKRVSPQVGTFRALQLAASNPLQKIFVSASLAYDTEVLRRWGLFCPQLFAAVESLPDEAADSSTVHEAYDMEQIILPPGLSQYTITTPDTRTAPLAVYAFIQHMNLKKVVCFVDVRDDADRLAKLLRVLFDSPSAACVCTAQMSYGQLVKRIRQFHQAKHRVLVGSDLVCRGMQFDGVDAVINYKPPTNVKQYVHRAGRTARAGYEGVVLTVCAGETQRNKLTQLLSAHAVSDTLTEAQIDLQTHMQMYKKALHTIKQQQEKQQRDRKQRRDRRALNRLAAASMSTGQEKESKKEPQHLKSESSRNGSKPEIASKKGRSIMKVPTGKTSRNRGKKHRSRTARRTNSKKS